METNSTAAVDGNNSSETTTRLSLADQIADTALQHYKKALPEHRGKPKENEWTVYAAIVATFSSNSSTERRKLWIVSCATGTKCCTVPQGIDDRSADTSLCILRDSHAEVLARRGLVRVLWKEIESKRFRDLPESLLEPIIPSSDNNITHDKRSTCCGPLYRLRQGVQLHLYVSDSPCGDASIYSLTDPTSNTNAASASSRSGQTPIGEQSPSPLLQFTGAKVIVSDKTNVTVDDCGGLSQVVHHTTPTTQLAREQNQVMGKLRTKSGRSNLHLDRRSVSMSCSDKLVRWNVLGLQGGMLSSIVTEPIVLSSIVVSHDPRSVSEDCNKDDDDKKVFQIQALERAIPKRVKAVRESLMRKIPYDNNNSGEPEQRIFRNFIKRAQEPKVFLSQRTFDRGKSSMEIQMALTGTIGRKRKRTEIGKDGKDTATTTNNTNNQTNIKVSPAGVSFNWQKMDNNDDNNDTEVLVGARGIRHGKKPKCAADYEHLQSRLCRHTMYSTAERFFDKQQESSSCTTANSGRTSCQRPEDCETTSDERSGSRNAGTSYQVFKIARSSSVYQTVRRQILFSEGPLAGWIVGNGQE